MSADTDGRTTARASISIMVPAFNEERDLRSSVLTAIEASSAVDKLDTEIIIINDGSSDNTAAIADALTEEYPMVRCIHFNVNRGLGAGFLAALEAARTKYITFITGDNIISTSAIREILKHIGQADIICSFPVNTECRPRSRRIISSLFSFIYRQTFNLDLQAIHAVTAFPVHLLRRMPLRSHGYSLASELMVKIMRQGGTFMELPFYYKELPTPDKSSAMKLTNLIDVIRDYTLLVVEVYVAHRSKYSRRAVRVIPEELRN